MFILCLGFHERYLLHFTLHIQVYVSATPRTTPSACRTGDMLHTCRMRNRLFSKSTPFDLRSSVTSFAEDFVPFT